MLNGTTRLRELTVRYAVKKDSGGHPVIVGRSVSNARDAAATFMATLADEPGEVFAILCLSTKNRVIAYHEVSRGTLDSTLVHPREVFKAALLANAASIIAAHCHPSGDCAPSPDDIALTTRLAAAGELLGVSVLDHIIVGDGRYFSFREAGRMAA
jgi:DNA repair protein RadC